MIYHDQKLALQVLEFPIKNFSR